MKLTNKIFLVASGLLIISCELIQSNPTQFSFQESGMFTWNRESNNPVITTNSILSVISSPSPTSIPTESPTPSPTILPSSSPDTIISPLPSISPTPSPVAITKGVLSIENPFVLKQDNKYKMWFDYRYLEDSTKINTLKNRIGYLESDDGIKWYNFKEAFNEKSNTWFSKSVFSPTIIFDKKQENPYLMYFTGLDSSSSDEQINRGYGYSIGLATSKDGFTFTPISQEKSPYLIEGLVLKSEPHNSSEPFTDKTTDKKEFLHLSDPSVIKISETYYMWYTNVTHKAFSQRFSSNIALATSNDGIKWTKKGSVLFPEQNWEKLFLEPSIGRPHILYDDKEKVFEMFYDALGYSEKSKLKTISGVGYAKSNDAVNWIKNNNNLIFKSNNKKGEESGIIQGISLIKDGDKYLLYYSGLNDQNTTININVSYGIKK